MIRNDHRHRTVNALIFCLMFHKLSEKKSNIRQLTDPYSLNRRICFIFHCVGANQGSINGRDL